ncbi:lysophospholipid acyltransferase family protein [Amycolatopsis thermoflava]|uniref:lysophospholipid acyltransferase family protein n=1 Tax=Amycolatopsis thermoflava TaxID=84480 RepID=UPI003807F983
MTTSAQAQVIPLHAPGREKPADVEARAGETPADAPVVAFPTRSAPAEEPPAPEPDALSRFLGFLRHRLTGDYEVDEFGFDPELTDNLLLPPLRLLYEKYFRVTTHGAENLPADGGALIVCNHSGTVPLDAVMTAVAVHDETPGHRHLRMLGADLVFQTPLLGALARKTGQTLACTADAERLLCSGELVGVWPEGYKGIGKPFSARYRLQRFGRGGFVSAALRTRVPIIPCSIVGAEEIYPKIGDLKPLARLLGLPYFPVTPFFPLLGPLGAIPLPTKWHIEFGEPIRTDGFADEDLDDPMLVFSLTDQVRESIQTTLYRRLAHRRSAFKD